MFGMFGGFGGYGGSRFEASYRCYPVSFLDKPEAERGDKIFLPPSALDRLGGQWVAILLQNPPSRLPLPAPLGRPFRPPSRLTNSTCRLPPAAQLHIDYPMLFQVENRRDGHSTHCGVLEFIADEGMVYMPYWVRGRTRPAVLALGH